MWTPFSSTPEEGDESKIKTSQSWASDRKRREI